jgi:hypothetical protein
MNWYSVFYWLTVASGVKDFFDVASNIFTWFAVLSFIALVIITIGKSITVSENRLKNSEDDVKDSDFRAWDMIKKYIQPFFYTMLGLSMITWTAWTLVPSKKDCAIIIAGGTVGNFLQSDTSARKTIPKAFNLLNAYLDKEYNEVLTSSERKELNVQTKEDIKEAKKEEFLDKITKAGTKLGKDELKKQLDEFLGDTVPTK